MTVRGERRPGVIVFGVGNPFRRDDGAGPEVARRLRAAVPPWVEVVEHDGEPTGLIDAWEGADIAIVVDAVSSLGAPGRIHRVEVDAVKDVEPAGEVSTHGASPGAAVALARALDRMPGRLVLYGIEGQIFTPGLGLSPEVEASVVELADHILNDEVPGRVTQGFG
jgi:hydrogenase maturation protease